MTLALSLVEKGGRPLEVCAALGVPRATFYRHRSPSQERDPRPRHRPANRLSDQENTKILETMHEEEYIDLCPREIVPKLADRGVYLGSIRTFYRILSRHQEVQERRLQARRPAIAAPVLEATRPNQVWTWDITRLSGPYQGKWYFLYMMLDLYSRYVVGWMVAERENVRISAKATARFASKRPVSAEGREALEDNVFQPVGLVRNRPLLDAPLRAIL